MNARKTEKAARKRAAIYTRISRDRTGDGAGVARQEEDCRAKATSLGYEVARVFTENDTSAYSKKPRPQYLAMLEAIRAGEFDAVIVWHTDRLYRRMNDLEEYINVCGGERRGIPTYTVKAEGSLDLTSPSGRMVARQLAAVAQYESEQKGARQQRANQQRATKGISKTPTRAFGWRADGLTLELNEAQAIREAYDLILNGGSLREVARRWNEAGHTGPQKARPWDGATVSRTMRLHRHAGMVTYRGEVVTDDNGEPIAGEWEPIVDRDTWYAAQAILNDPARRKTPVHPSRLLLSGVAKCAECGANIASGGKRKGKPRYRCGKLAGHVYRMAEPIDELVTSVVLARLEQPDAAEALRPGTGTDVAALRREANEIHQRMDGLAEAFADGDLTISQFKKANERLRAKLAEIEARIPTDTGSTAIQSLVTSPDIRAAWDALSIDAKRGVIDTLVTVRLLSPVCKEFAYLPGTGWSIANPESVVIEWR